MCKCFNWRFLQAIVVLLILSVGFLLVIISIIGYSKHRSEGKYYRATTCKIENILNCSNTVCHEWIKLLPFNTCFGLQLEISYGIADDHNETRRILLVGNAVYDSCDSAVGARNQYLARVMLRLLIPCNFDGFIFLGELVICLLL